MAKGTIHLFSTKNFSTVEKCFINTGIFSSKEVTFVECCKDKKSIFNFVLTDCNNNRHEFAITIEDFIRSLHNVDTCVDRVSYITFNSIIQ